MTKTNYIRERILDKKRQLEELEKNSVQEHGSFKAMYECERKIAFLKLMEEVYMLLESDIPCLTAKDKQKLLRELKSVVENDDENVEKFWEN